MALSSLHISETIDRPLAEVYAYAADPTHLPEWAAGLSGSIELIDGQWLAESPMGRIVVTMAPANDYGVLDHYVALPDGRVFYNPMRVLADDDGSEIVFTLRRLPGVSDEEFARDADTVREDLARLKRLLTNRPASI
jgi:uncharacterized protein YndB with AHSA1/START domain